MKALLAACLLFSMTAFAYSTPYDSMMADCLDYGHSPVSREKQIACHETVKNTILDSSENAQMIYLDCIDYGHSRVSLEKDIQCAKEASKALEN